MSEKSKETEQTKQANELSPERAAELKGLGFITSLQGAGMPDDKIGELYSSYREQDEQRRVNLESAYEVLTGKDQQA